METIIRKKFHEIMENENGIHEVIEKVKEMLEEEIQKQLASLKFCE